MQRDSYSNPLINQLSTQIETKKNLVKDYEYQRPILQRKVEDAKRELKEEEKHIKEQETEKVELEKKLRLLENTLKQSERLLKAAEDKVRFSETEFLEHVKKIERTTFDHQQLEQKRASEILRLARESKTSIKR